MFRFRKTPVPDPAADRVETPDQDRAELLGWAVVANVSGETRYGEGGAGVRSGVKHFTPGTKVWVLPAQWGDGWENAVVVGRHRGGSRLAQMVMPLKHLQDFRVEAVYSPAVDRELRKPYSWGQTSSELRQWASREEAQRVIERHPVTVGRLKSGGS